MKCAFISEGLKKITKILDASFFFFINQNPFLMYHRHVKLITLNKLHIMIKPNTQVNTYQPY